MKTTGPRLPASDLPKSPCAVIPNSPTSLSRVSRPRSASDWEAANAESNAYSRQGELTRELFDRLDWPEDEFIGYRCQVDFPFSAVEYNITFDFSR